MTHVAPLPARVRHSFKYPKLVRVVWQNVQTRRKRSFAAGVLARDMEHAFDIAECIVGCMVPITSKTRFRVHYALAELERDAVIKDATDPRTVWTTFHKEVI